MNAIVDTGILLVAAQRELRRRLFDVFDGAGFPQIHSARDVPHAAILLEGRPPLLLMVLAVGGTRHESIRQIELLRQLPGAHRATLMLVLADDSPLDPLDLPGDIHAWLYARQIDAELLARWRRTNSNAMAGQASTGSPEPQCFETVSWLDEQDSEWLLLDERASRVIAVSEAMIRHSGLPAAWWNDLPLGEAVQFDGVQFDGVAVATHAPRGERAWRPCRRKSVRGYEAGQFVLRQCKQPDGAAWALFFRSARADCRAEAALSLLQGIFAPADGLVSHEAVAQRVFESMALDYLAVWAVRHDGKDGDAPELLVHLAHGHSQEWSGSSLQSPLQLVLAGKPVLYHPDTQQGRSPSPLLQRLGLSGLVGLPLYDERRVVLGAMLVGIRRAFGEFAVAEPTLRCVAARFAQVLELRNTREQGRAEGLMDALTGLPNRLLFNDRLETILREANRNGECFAVLFVDLDQFKGINDTHGHAAGDQVLRAFAQRLSASIRASDTVARYAGDEFTVLLRHIVKSEDVLRVAEKIVQVMEAPLHLDNGTELSITASLGLSFFPDDATDAPGLLKHADEAMYAAKREGGDTFRVYQGNPEQSRQQGMALRSRLRQAEGNGELRVVYQPQVSTITEDIVGMEALLRWDHPELGVISPAVFIPLAEETGLIVSIGEWVLRTACRQAQQWQERYGLRLRLGVNLSAVQLMEPTLLEMVLRALRDTGLDPGLLELEVTESVSIKAAPNLVENLHALHRLGCRIAIDDFGTGAASLDYLRRMPADRIKIDQSFVRNIGVDPDDEAIVRATIDMAHRLKRAVVAEGVEVEQHLQFLREHHCEELQGYLFCRPITPVSFDNLLAERQRLLEVGGSETA